MQVDEITFTENRFNWTKTLVLAALLGATGVWTLLFVTRLLGVALLVASVLPAGVLAPRPRYLRLKSTGFELGRGQYKDYVDWGDVVEFRLKLQDEKHVIEIGYIPEYSLGCMPPTTRCIFDRYNAPLSEVLDSLNEWRRRYAPQD
jgi:hypothetical protein